MKQRIILSKHTPCDAEVFQHDTRLVYYYRFAYPYKNTWLYSWESSDAFEKKIEMLKYLKLNYNLEDYYIIDKTNK